MHGSQVKHHHRTVTGTDALRRGKRGHCVKTHAHVQRGMGEKGGESIAEGRQVEKDSRRKKRRESGLGEEERADGGPAHCKLI